MGRMLGIKQIHMYMHICLIAYSHFKNRFYLNAYLYVHCLYVLYIHGNDARNCCNAMPSVLLRVGDDQQYMSLPAGLLHHVSISTAWYLSVCNEVNRYFEKD